MVSVEGELSTIEPSSELLQGEDDGKKFTASSRVITLSRIESATGKTDELSFTINNLVKYGSNT